MNVGAKINTKYMMKSSYDPTDFLIITGWGVFIAYISHFHLLLKIVIVLIHAYLGFISGKRSEEILNNEGYMSSILHMGLYLSIGSVIVAVLWSIEYFLSKFVFT